MNEEFLETFFAGCDESTMAKLIAMFEAGDQERLNDFVEGLADDETRKQLLEGLAKIAQFKSMEDQDD